MPEVQPRISNLKDTPGSTLNEQIHSLQVTRGREQDLRVWLQKRKDFTTEEQIALSLHTPQQFAEFWTNKSKQSEEKLQNVRSRGWKKWTYKYQTFGAGVMGFMRDWEPVINVVKTGGGRYGELVFGTFSALFVVAEYKEEMEGYLSTALSDIKDAMMGFALYEDIFTNEDALEQDVRNKVVDAYSQFVILAVDATKYYKGSGRNRWALIARIRLRCDDIMSRDITGLKHRQQELQNEVQRLRETLDKDRMNHIYDSWKIPYLSIEQRSSDLGEYRNQLRLEIGQDLDGFFESRDSKRAKFDQSPEFQTWISSSKSGLLILVGYSHYSVADYQYYCWLSPVVVDLVKQAQDQHRLHAYYILPAKGSINLSSVILSLLSQVLPYQCAKLRDVSVWQELKRLYSKVAALSAREEPGFELDQSLKELSICVLNMFDSSSTIYLFLDRVDRCYRSDEDSRLALLRILAEVARDTKPILKTFAVVSGTDWNCDFRELKKEFRDRVVIYAEQQKRIRNEDNY